VGVSVELRGVSKRYRTNEHVITALKDVELAVPEGTVMAITGPPGSGKSTLLHVIGAMDRPDSGVVRVGQWDVTALGRSRESAFRRTVGFVYQYFQLRPALSVLDNVVGPLPHRMRFDKVAKGQRLLATVGLEGREKALPPRLSGDERLRVAIARALINDPGLLLADEPTGNLDSGAAIEIMQLLLDLRADQGMTVIVASHNPLVASRCDRMIRLQDGAVVEDLVVRRTRTPDELLKRIGRLGPGA
jgi:putative ABC transport system ATP-binding protein